MRHRLDASGIHRLHLLDQAEDAAEFFEGGLRISFGNFDAGKMGDTFYVVGSK